MTNRFWILLLILVFFFGLTGNPAIASDTRDMMAGHAFYGKMKIDDSGSDIEGGDFEITVFGVDGQKPLGGDSFKYGWETGLLFSIDSDTRTWAASGGSGGGTVAVAVDVNSAMIDYFLGGYISIEPNKHFRLYAGAGPLGIWARRETEPEESAPDYVTSSTDSEWGAGVYARVGLDIFFNDQFGIFAGGRITETTLTFKDDTGEIDLEGYQCYFGVAFRF
jgi:hypothetical protein